MSVLQSMLQKGLGGSSYPENSRYHGSATRSHTTVEGREIAYLERRFVPDARRFDAFLHHVVAEGDRLDVIAARLLGDPLLYWRICDANGAIRPDELVEESGRTLRLTLPEGVPGVSSDED